MGLNFSRRNFLKTSALVAGASTVGGCTSGPLTLGKSNMCGFAAPKIDKIRVAIIGLGNRGSAAVQRLMKIADLEIVALSDLREAQVKKSNQLLIDAGLKPAKEFHAGPDDYKKICEMDIDLVYCCTSWEYHTPIAVYAMKHGSHTATELPAGKTIDELWELVETSEATKKHCMMLENTCYDFFELNSLNMVRHGVFGEITHAEGAYIHTIVKYISGETESYYKNWRLDENTGVHGSLYPTHGLGPVAQCMNINRGNQFDYMVSMSSQEAAFSEFTRQHKRPDLLRENYRGDMNTSIIKTTLGQTIMVQHDVSTPRPYSRIHMLQGSRGMLRKYPREEYALISDHDGHGWLDEEAKNALEEKYKHPLIKTMGDIAQKVGGHGGMDFMMDYRLIYCLKNGLALDQDVYDAASWSSIIPLSIDSVAKRSASLDVPDFTRGNWKTNKPLGIVDVNPKKLRLHDTTQAKGQLNVH
ncbi:Gfo/Idh/MocA family oxidoreductase [Lentisphaera profundi]|uniref:Gfo/Idh/MocA family oxidoreductase n=1 Tax=Lentisphaera profundi TaxID=1658616 RepID=A0ABY7VSG5_9BACT|nr:Gfo/Idh/MocA family oxidoreductase [Lentisphaera profundi]WDE95786.1 Gfo/Idh/MocA family oxidoreductase [Lentisphaera profundi]